MENYFKKLDFDTLVIISTKENPGLFLPAKIEQIIEVNNITKTNNYKSYKFNVRTVNYEKEPHNNFPGTDTTFLVAKDLAYLDTVDRFKSEQLHYVNKYL